MGQEIERKFLVRGEGWRGLASGIPYCQGYIKTVQGDRPHRSVRIRIAGSQGYLTIKGPIQGITRSEFEYPIPVAEAREMLESLCDRPLIEKIRYKIPFQGLTWELDEFLGENQGLLIAEVELLSESQDIVLPDWVGEEVTGDRRYYNSALANHPFSAWT